MILLKILFWVIIFVIFNALYTVLIRKYILTFKNESSFMKDYLQNVKIFLTTLLTMGSALGFMYLIFKLYHIIFG